MRTVMALVLTLPLLACESESLMERSGETLDDATDEVTDTIEDTREEVEDGIEQTTD
jgi:PhoPQ-activated pathogenicity-related protein